MSMYTIETGIPLPENTGRKRKYPFREMLVGNSFFVPCASYDECRRVQTSIHGNVRRFKPKRFTSEVYNDEGKRGVRIWRVE